VLLILALVVVVIYLIAHGVPAAGGPALTPTAAPTSYFTQRIDSAPRSAVLSYARSLNYDTRDGVGDFRRLMVGSCPRCIYGPHVFLRPEHGAAALQRAMLAQGRVVARLTNNDSIGYPKFNLAPLDTVYWWVDSVRTGFRSVYVSSNPARALVTDSLFIIHHPGYSPWALTLARFLWRDTDEALWIACDMTGCCKSSGADIY